ncbi:MAG TPA: TetR/AcrR family transcriptional regulator [Rhizomicrobium sp.]|jgi:TetR/AcrR family transcriptional repressor of bet genes|nr:TetR/AcrR family transcriptional regulator [Rhizomicrobium sp.]
MPKIVDHEDRMRCIAGAAIHVIGKSGIEGMRLRDVAKAADVTTGAVTHYFDGKDAVLEAALDEVVRRMLAMQRDAQATGDGFVGAAASFMPNSEAQRRDWRVWFAFWGRAMSDRRLRAKHRTAYAAFSANTLAGVREMQKRGLADPKTDARAMADALIAVTDGLGIRVSLEPEDWPLERQKKTLRVAIEPILRGTNGRK